ncbi:hypothetical protein GS898_04950 [Rhodococcus hoagii]|nr:hypothetical protein [Prescottella equi]
MSGTDFGHGAAERQAEQVCREALKEGWVSVSTRRNIYEPARKKLVPRRFVDAIATQVPVDELSGRRGTVTRERSDGAPDDPVSRVPEVGVDDVGRDPPHGFEGPRSEAGRQERQRRVEGGVLGVRNQLQRGRCVA